MAVVANSLERTEARYAGGSLIIKILQYAVLIFFALVCLVPIFWVPANSLKTTRENALNPLGPPTTFRWDNYAEAWTVGRFGRYFANSIIVTVPIVIGSVGLSSLASYSLARFKIPGSNLIFYTFLLGLMVPFQSIMIPLFYILRDIQLLGTYWAMILPSIVVGLPFGIFSCVLSFSGSPMNSPTPPRSMEQVSLPSFGVSCCHYRCRRSPPRLFSNSWLLGRNF